MDRFKGRRKIFSETASRAFREILLTKRTKTNIYEEHLMEKRMKALINLKLRGFFSPVSGFGFFSCFFSFFMVNPPG